jgi:hypothetical protein
MVPGFSLSAAMFDSRLFSEAFMNLKISTIDISLSTILLPPLPDLTIIALDSGTPK